MSVQAIGVLLVLINIITVTGPVAGIAILYQDHLTELVIPPQITQILNDTFTLGQQEPFAEVIDAQFDKASRTLTLTVNFTNPLNYTLTLKSLTATVECSTHSYPLGQVNIDDTNTIPPAQTAQIIVFGAWTENGENHFNSEHAGATSLDIRLTNIAININEITVEMAEPIEIPNVPVA